MRAREQLRSRLIRRGEAVHSSTDIESLAADRDRHPVTPALMAAVAQRATGRISGGLSGTGQLSSSISNLVQGVTMTTLARHFAARPVGALILGSLMVGSGVLGYQALVQGLSSGDDDRHAAAWRRSAPAKLNTEDPALTVLHWVDSMEKLATIGSAINGFHKANGILPPAAIRDPNTGKPLLSWPSRSCPGSDPRTCTSSSISTRPGTAHTTKRWSGKCPMHMLRREPRPRTRSRLSIRCLSGPEPRLSHSRTTASSVSRAFTTVPQLLWRSSRQRSRFRGRNRRTCRSCPISRSPLLAECSRTVSIWFAWMDRSSPSPAASTSGS